MHCLVGFLPELLLVRFATRVLAGPEYQSLRRACDFIYLAFRQDIVDAGTAGLDYYVGGPIKLKEELIEESALFRYLMYFLILGTYSVPPDGHTRP